MAAAITRIGAPRAGDAVGRPPAVRATARPDDLDRERGATVRYARLYHLQAEFGFHQFRCRHTWAAIWIAVQRRGESGVAVSQLRLGAVAGDRRGSKPVSGRSARNLRLRRTAGCASAKARCGRCDRSFLTISTTWSDCAGTFGRRCEPPSSWMARAPLLDRGRV